MALDYNAFPAGKRETKMLDDRACVLPIGRLSWTKDLVTGSANQKGTWMWMATLLCPPGSIFQVAQKLMYPIAYEHLKDKDRAVAAVKARFIDPNNKPGGGKPEGEEFEGWTMIRLSTSKKPDIILPNGARCEEADLDRECYSGRWAFCTASAYWFDVGTNKGVSLGLQNVILQDHDEPMGGGKPRGTSDYNALADAGILDAQTGGGGDDPFGDDAGGGGEDTAPDDEDDEIPF